MTILLIDDAVDHAELVLRSFRKHRIANHIHHVSHGLEVFRIIRASPEIAHIPIIVLATSDAEQDVASAYNYHINSYLVKPVDFNSFTQIIGELGAYWLTWNHYSWSEQAQ